MQSIRPGDENEATRTKPGDKDEAAPSAKKAEVAPESRRKMQTNKWKEKVAERRQQPRPETGAETTPASTGDFQGGIQRGKHYTTTELH